MSVPAPISIVALTALVSCAEVAAPGASAGEARSATEPARPAAARCASAADVPPGLAPLPVTLGGFCLEAHGRVRVYGAGAPLSLEQACDQVLGPGCAEPGEHALERVLAVRYADAAGGRASLDVIAARYADAAGAHARFGDDLIGERDPAELVLDAIDAPGVAAREADRFVAWLGRHVLIGQYADPGAASDERAAAAAALLPELARRLLEALPGPAELPAAVQKLPAAHRVPFGTRFVLGDVLGIPGVGMGAIGYHRNGDKRWRTLAIVRPDADSARDVLGTFAASPVARRIERAPLEAVALTLRRLPTEPNLGWVVGRRGELVYGVGDEAAVLPENTSAEREAAVKLSLPEKLVELTRINTE